MSVDLERFKENWKALRLPEAKLELQEIIKRDSGSALYTLRENMYWEVALIALLFLFLMVYEAFTGWNGPTVFAADGVLVYTLFSVFFALSFLYFFKVLSLVGDAQLTQTTLSSLTDSIIRLERALEIYKTFNVVLIPIALILVLSMTSIGFVGRLLSDYASYLPLFFVAAIAICYFATEYCVRNRFGKHVRRLEKNLSDLQA